MSMSDPIADMLTRIRNAVAARHDVVTIPSSKVKMAIADVLKSEGFIRDYAVLGGDEKPQKDIKVELSYGQRRTPAINGIKRVSKPGLRVYSQRSEIPRVYGGLGVAIVSTPKGIMTGQEARREHVGGEILCYVW